MGILRIVIWRTDGQKTIQTTEAVEYWGEQPLILTAEQESVYKLLSWTSINMKLNLDIYVEI